MQKATCVKPTNKLMRESHICHNVFVILISIEFKMYTHGMEHIHNITTHKCVLNEVKEIKSNFVYIFVLWCVKISD